MSFIYKNLHTTVMKFTIQKISLLCLLTNILYQFDHFEFPFWSFFLINLRSIEEQHFCEKAFNWILQLYRRGRIHKQHVFHQQRYKWIIHDLKAFKALFVGLFLDQKFKKHSFAKLLKNERLNYCWEASERIKLLKQSRNISAI